MLDSSLYSAPEPQILTDAQVHIPTLFEKCIFKSGQSFKARVSQIYDPSKFWIVTKFRELENFQKYLCRWYRTNRNRCSIPANKVVKDMYCVVLDDGGYYRGSVVGFPNGHGEEQEVQILFIDYGMVKIVDMDNIFYLNENCRFTPKLAIRASLAGICPRSRPQWTVADVTEFHKMVDNKILVGVIVNVDPKRHLLEVHLSEEKNGAVLIPFHKTLIAQKRARFFHDKAEQEEEKGPLRPKLKFPYLFPSHEAIESGKVPSNLSDAEYQVHFSCLSSLVFRYYKNVSDGFS